MIGQLPVPPNPRPLRILMNVLDDNLFGIILTIGHLYHAKGDGRPAHFNAHGSKEVCPGD